MKTSDLTTDELEPLLNEALFLLSIAPRGLWQLGMSEMMLSLVQQFEPESSEIRGIVS